MPTDAIVKITSTAICGSDLHLYELFGPFIDKGDVLATNRWAWSSRSAPAVTALAVGDRVVVPFNISCGHCFMCRRGLQSQCETTQVREYGSGAALFGYTKLYGQVPGGQAEYLRVPLADYNLIRVGDDLPDDRYLFLSDIVPTAWQGVQYANVPEGGTLAVMGLGPVGQFAARIGVHLGYRVLAIEPEPERRALAERHGILTYDLTDTVVDELVDPHRGARSGCRRGCRGHGGARQRRHQAGPERRGAAARRPRAEGDGQGGPRPTGRGLRLDRPRAPRGDGVAERRLRGGGRHPAVKTMFDKQLNLRMGQCNVKRWIDDLLPLVEDPTDPLGVMDLVTHHAPLEDAPRLYETFQKKEDGCIKVVLRPGS